MADEKGVPTADIERQLSIIDSMRRGMPRDLYVKVRELECELGAAESEEVEQEVEGRLAKLHEESRSVLAELRKAHRELRKGFLPVHGLRPVPAEHHMEHFRTVPGLLAESARDLSPVGVIIPGPGCGPVSNNFTIRFDRCRSATVWNAETTNEVNGGVIGWSHELSRKPTISNMNGKGDMNGELEIRLSGTAPGDDIYLMRPNIPVLVSGETFAEGVFGGGIDAEASVELISIISVGGTIISASAYDLSSVESYYWSDDDYFSEYLILSSGQIAFSARKGQEVQILIRLAGDTWTKSGGDAEIIVDMFGVIANVPGDLDIPVVTS
jgi:hypothetical protein